MLKLYINKRHGLKNIQLIQDDYQNGKSQSFQSPVPFCKEIEYGSIHFNGQELEEECYYHYEERSRVYSKPF